LPSSTQHRRPVGRCRPRSWEGIIGKRLRSSTRPAGAFGRSNVRMVSPKKPPLNSGQLKDSFNGHPFLTVGRHAALDVGQGSKNVRAEREGASGGAGSSAIHVRIENRPQTTSRLPPPRMARGAGWVLIGGRGLGAVQPIPSFLERQCPAEPAPSRARLADPFGSGPRANCETAQA
jgi:hypothetical protein